MTLPILSAVYTTGQKIYAVEKNRITGQTWNTSTSAWETFNPANWGVYAVALAEDIGSGFYWILRPSSLAGSLVSDIFYHQSGASPATSDVAFLESNNGLGDNVAAIAGDASVAPINLQAGLATAVRGTVASGVINNMSFITSLTSLQNLMVGRTLYFTSGAMQGSAVQVLAFSNTTAQITVAALPGVPAVGDAFIII